jgi:hypothetical protein
MENNQKQTKQNKSVTKNKPMIDDMGHVHTCTKVKAIWSAMCS